MISARQRGPALLSVATRAAMALVGGPALLSVASWAAMALVGGCSGLRRIVWIAVTSVIAVTSAIAE